MLRTVRQDGRVMRLRSVMPAMVVTKDADRPVCRTVYEDERGRLWCMLIGRYYRVHETDGGSLRRGVRSKAVYEAEV